MLALSASLLALAAVASAAARLHHGSVAASLLAATACVLRFGLGVGLLVLLLVAMSATSALVLVLAPRPALCRPVALASGLVGITVLLGQSLATLLVRGSAPFGP